MTTGSKDTIAAFSPSGLSLDGPAHQYLRALMAELASAYAQTGLMPELLSAYHLLGDPAMKVR